MLAEIDILNRQEFINKIISTVEYHSKSNLKASFSIQGEWGCGKSWILDRVFESLYDIQDERIAGGRYCVFRYNAWKYDYYDEPLFSLLISLKEQFDVGNAVFIKTKNAQKNFKVVKKMVKEYLPNVFHKTSLLLLILAFLFHIIGYLCMFLFCGMKIKKHFINYKEKVEDEIRKYDPNYDLNSLMNSIIRGLIKISEEKTIVVIVDELDRCLPEHAIKVLERMHHISQNVNNIQFIYGIDKTQIENNVAQIFVSENNDEKGKQERVKKYLSKFINFGLEVPKAEYTNEIEKKYHSLFSSFDNINTCSFDVMEKVRIIAEAVSPRIFEQIVHKIILTNAILNQNNEKLDNSILVFELFYAITLETNFDWPNTHVSYEREINRLEMKSISISYSPAIGVFNRLIDQKNIVAINQLRYDPTRVPLYTDFENNKAKSIISASLPYYFESLKSHDSFWFDNNDVLPELNRNLSYLRQYIDYYKSLDM